MKWQLLNRNAGGGKQKGKGKKREHQHTWPETGKPWKGKAKEKADGRRAKNQPEEGGRQKRLTQPTRREPKPT